MRDINEILEAGNRWACYVCCRDSEAEAEDRPVQSGKAQDTEMLGPAVGSAGQD